MNNEEKNNKPIVIDISNIDTKSVKKQEYFLQKDGFKKVSELLKKEATCKKVKKKNSSLQRSHNTIFINGKRGSGKTQFLISIRNYLKKNDKKTLKKLYFIKSIDPTLLHDNESFLTIIIAKILNQLEEENKLNDLEKEEQTEFYKYLSNISLAIDGVIHQHNKNKSSLEHIAQDQTSLRLERYLDEFFYKVTKIIQKKKIVLLIDDIDMALTNGFEVLEVIKKYLTSQYILPIVTGDIDLYTLLVKDYFCNSIKNSRQIDTNNLLEETALDYLIKLFPIHKRIYMQTIYELVKDTKIEFNYNGDKYFFKCDTCKEDNSSKNYYFRLKALEIFQAKVASNKFVENLFSNPLRRIMQFLHQEYDMNNKSMQFAITNVKSIKRIEEKYYLNLLKGVESYQTYLEEGSNYFKNNEFEEAIKYCDKSLKLKETYRAYFLKANALSNLKKYFESIDEYEKAIVLNTKNDYQVYLNLGYVYAKLKQNDKAISNYDKALRIQPKLNIAYIQKGLIYYEGKEYNEALKNYFHALKIDSNDGSTYYNIGLIYSKQQEYKKAIESYKKSKELKPQNETYLCLLELYLITNNYGAYQELEQEFLLKNQKNDKSMKIYKILDILTLIISTPENNIKNIEQNVEQQYKEWQKKYKNIEPEVAWSFIELETWLKNFDNHIQKELIQKYLKKFKENM